MKIDEISNLSNEQDCEQKLQCAACLVAFDKKDWSKNERHNHASKQGTLLVCKSCRDSRGYTPDDVKTYTCQQCHDKGGWKLFDKELMHHVKSHGRKKLLWEKGRRKSCNRNSKAAKGSASASVQYTANPVH